MASPQGSTGRPIKIFAAALGLLCLSGVSAACAAKTSLCTQPETVIFSCPAGKNIVSVCAPAGEGPLYYRFGTAQAKAFSLPAQPPAAKTSDGATVTSRSLMFSGGGGAYLRFTKGEYDYIVFTAVGKGWGEKQGVAVEKNGKTISYHACTAEPVSELGDAYFTKAAIPEDAEEFLLPD